MEKENRKKLNLKVNAQELCTMCVMAWPGPLPPFQGVQGVLPYGVKNVIKWKSALRLDKLIRKQHEKLKKEKIWSKKEYHSMLHGILFFKQAYTFEDSNKNFITFYEGIENTFASIRLKDNGEYEINNYLSREEWLESIMCTYDEIIKNENVELFTIIHHYCGKKGKEVRDRYSIGNWDMNKIK